MSSAIYAKDKKENESMNRDAIVELAKEKPFLREHLFTRGFLMTDAQQDGSAYPFYNSWKHYTLDNYHFYVHPKQTAFFAKSEKVDCFMLGHAYNPFTMEIDEQQILQKMTDVTDQERINILNQLTGVFTIGWIEQDKLTLVSDCAGMQVVYYGMIGGKVYASTHMQLIGDLCNLKMSEYVQELVAYRHYHYYGAFLPGDLSAYDELKRIVPNTIVTYQSGVFSVHRFYPVKPLHMSTSNEEYLKTIEQISDIMHRSMELIALKWKKPAISLSGGMDSKGTLAAANGLYDRFRCFSYISIPGEQIDAEAAHKICEAIHVVHKIDIISDQNEDFDQIENLAVMLQHNYGDIGALNSNDIRKRVFYLQTQNCDFDVEVKSWVSEIGRANYYKKFGFKKMPRRLSPRQMTTMYKFFLENRQLVRQTDSVFKDYINKTAFDEILNYDSSDMFLWEMRYGSWGGQVITCEQKFSFDITIPYNNRLLLELFLSTPLEKRVSDQVHYDLIRHLNPAIDATGITITNYNETRARMYKEKLYYLVHTHLPI